MAKRIDLSYEVWMRETKRNLLTPRSKLLQAVDVAYEKYWTAATDTNRARLVSALNNWINSPEQGADSAPNTQDGKWRNSTRNKTGTVELLHTQLNPPPVPPQPGEIRFAPSFNMASSKEREDCKRAFVDAFTLIQKAWPYIALLKDGISRTTYEFWFGKSDPVRHAEVRRKMDKINTALTSRPIMLYYRGAGLPGGTPNDEAGRVTPIGAEDFFGAAYPIQPPLLDNSFTHIFIGKAFFDSATLFQNDSMAGVMIHELSHAICQTDDVVYKGQQTYGEALCEVLAAERPDLAINNADSYEYYCESFHGKRYRSTRPALQLPAKASINLSL